MAKETQPQTLLGLHYGYGTDTVTITLFEGPPGSSGKRPLWSERTKIVDEETFYVSKFPEVLEDDGEGENAGPKSFAAFGLMNLLTDRTSQVTEGPREKLDAMRQYADVFKRGIWRERKARTGGAGKVDSTFALAVARTQGLKDSQVSAVAAQLRKMDAATLKGVRKLEAVQAEMEKIRKEAEGAEVELKFDLPTEE